MTPALLAVSLLAAAIAQPNGPLLSTPVLRATELENDGLQADLDSALHLEEEETNSQPEIDQWRFSGAYLLDSMGVEERKKVHTEAERIADVLWGPSVVKKGIDAMARKLFGMKNCNDLSLDLHTRTFMGLVKTAYFNYRREVKSDWEEDKVQAVGDSKDWGGGDYLSDTVDGARIPTDDEDFKLDAMYQLCREYSNKALSALPMYDIPAPDGWCPAVGYSIAMEKMHDTLPALESVQTEWSEVDSDKTLGLISFYGIGQLRLVSLAKAVQSSDLERRFCISCCHATCHACTMDHCTWHSMMPREEACQGFLGRGFGQRTTQPQFCPKNEPMPVYPNKEKKPPPGTSHVIDLSFMGRFAVRPPFERYGGILYLKKQGEVPLGIWWEHEQRMVLPGDKAWAHAKFSIMSSLGLAVLFLDHLTHVHFVVSNRIIMAQKDYLHQYHPIRHMLKPFSFRTALINQATAITLMQPKGMLHRTTALSAHGIKDFFHYGFLESKYQPFPVWLSSKGLTQKDVPMAEDGLPLHHLFEKMVGGLLDVYYKDDAELQADLDMDHFWHGMQKNHPEFPWFGKQLPALNKGNLKSLLAHYMFTVTAMHELAGHVVEYTTVPSLFASKIRPDVEIADPQAFFQLLSVTSLTGLRLPPLMHDARKWMKDARVYDWTHVFEPDGQTIYHKDKSHRTFEEVHRARAVEVWHEFQDALIVHAHEVDMKNDQRPHKFVKMHPAYLESSISV